MELFKGLYIGEVVLLLLGVIFFLVLLILLVFLVIRKRSFKPMIPLFLFPIVMIGFPSLKKIKYDNGVLEIEKETRYVKDNPKDTAAQKILIGKIKELESRAVLDPTAQMTLANANLSVGDTIKARKAVNEALKINPRLVPAQEFSKRINKR